MTQELCAVCGFPIDAVVIAAALKDCPFEIDLEKANFAHAECAISDGMADDDPHLREIGCYVEERA